MNIHKILNPSTSINTPEVTVSFVFAGLIFAAGIFGFALTLFFVRKYSYGSKSSSVGVKYIMDLRRKKTKPVTFFSLIESAASGVFLAIALVHLIPDAFVTEANNNIFGTNTADAFIILMLIVGASFIFFLFLDHLPGFFEHSKKHRSTKASLILVWVSLIVHSFFIGLAVGFSSNAIAVLIPLFIAIFVHKFFVAFALTIKLLRQDTGLKLVVLLMTIFSISTPLGAVLSTVIDIGSIPRLSDVIAIFTVASAGVLLYLGTLHELTESPLISYCCNYWNFIALVLGFGLLGGLAFAS